MTQQIASTAPAGLWRNADFRNLWLGLTTSLFGAKITVIALPLIASLTLHASPLEMGALVAMGYLPYLAVSMPAGVWLDRRPKRPLLILSDVARAALLLAIPLSWLLGALSVPLLLGVSLLVGLCTVVSDIGTAAYLPSIVGRNQLVEGNSKLELSNSAANIGGNVLGGGVLQLVSAPLALMVNSAAYLLSAAFTFRIRHRERMPERPAPDTGSRMLAEIREGARAVYGHPVIRRLVLATLIFNFFTFAIEPVFLLFLTRTLELPAFAIGLVFAASGVGALVGALIAGPVTHRLGLGRTLVGALVTAGAAALLMPTAVLVPARSAIFVIGAMYFVDSAMVIVYNINQRSLRAALTPDHLQARMNASVRMVVMGAAPAGAFAGGLLSGWLGTLPVLVIGAGGILLAGGSLLLSRIRTISGLPGPGTAEIPGPIRRGSTAGGATRQR